MKLKSPDGITDIHVAGVNYTPDEHGVFTVDDSHAGHFFQFGFVSAEAPAQPDQEPTNLASETEQPADPVVAETESEAAAAHESAEAPAQRKKK